MTIENMKKELNPDMFWINLDNNIRKEGLYNTIERINKIRKQAIDLIYNNIFIDKNNNPKAWVGFQLALHIIHPDTYYDTVESFKKHKRKTTSLSEEEIDYTVHYLMYSSLSLICTLLTKIQISNKDEVIIICKK